MECWVSQPPTDAQGSTGITLGGFCWGCWAERLSLVPSFAMVMLGADPSRSPPWH